MASEIKRSENILGPFSELPSINVEVFGLWKKMMGESEKNEGHMGEMIR